MKGKRSTTLPCVLDNHDLSEPIQRFVRNATADKQTENSQKIQEKRKGKRNNKHTEEGNCQPEHSRVCTWKTTPNGMYTGQLLASARVSGQVMQFNLINTPEIWPLRDSRYIIIYPTPEKAILILLFVDSICIKQRL